jgi:exodeoxyribonuclease V beta subunit
MTQDLIPLKFPLRGTRLIEASAGTGKTWTIAALYVRLVLGHVFSGAEDESDLVPSPHLPHPPLLPSQILVMTFTRAATRELTDRIRARLVEAARCFRGEAPRDDDTFLHDLIDCHDADDRKRAAHRLMLAAEAMDDAAIFTIDAWCQRMLREHAFDSGCLFDEELTASEDALLRDAARDYWRHEVYSLQHGELAAWRQHWSDLASFEKAVAKLVDRVELLTQDHEQARETSQERLQQQKDRLERLGTLMARIAASHRAALGELKPAWRERIPRMQAWMAQQRERAPKGFSGVKLKPDTVNEWFALLQRWTEDQHAVMPEDRFEKAWSRLSPSGIEDACNKGFSVEVPDDFAQLAVLREQLNALEPLKLALLRHAAVAVAERVAELKRRMRQFGFADMLIRLKLALEGENGAVLRQRIVDQFPVALVDEFQDTSPDQYRILDLLYRVAENDPGRGLFLIGDPKQAIYGFRGADIHSYLAARRATEGRHYRLGTNFRSTGTLVEAVNHLFLHAEERRAFPSGAFRFRTESGNPLPFEAVGAKGRKERLVRAGGDVPALTFWCSQDKELKADAYRTHFAARCAESIVTLLNDAQAGFASDDGFAPLRPADIAILVRDRKEAAAVRRALQQRRVASVYLSDKDSVFRGGEAADVLHWLHAVANPLDSRLARAAFATTSAGLSLSELAELASDDVKWEARIEQLKAWRLIWQRQGVLAMLRRLIHELGLPARLLHPDCPGGERRLTDLLHLAEMLQTASQQLDGEQALIRWLADQIENDSQGGDERILRLESDAELVKVVTVHKSKGLEYPLVFVPFAVSARPVNARERLFYEYTDASGQRRIDFTLSDEGKEAMENARLEEDLRLFYVALTRARHALWLGIASMKDKIHESAFGYLLGGGSRVTAAQLHAELQAMCAGCAHLTVEDGDAPVSLSGWQRPAMDQELADPPIYAAAFERNWTIASYTSLTRLMESTRMPSTPLEEKLLDEEDSAGAVTARSEAPWHRFPRGSLPGQFLHAQLEWLAQEGFGIAGEASFTDRMALRCERNGWGAHAADVAAWLRETVTTMLPPLGVSLRELDAAHPETEFWFPASRLETAQLDALCHEHLLDGMTRPQLRRQALNGMLRGFKDLVFEHEGKFWVLDYKSNVLGPDDGSYHAQALSACMAAHRYEVQAVIYLTALHRLLRSRLGAAYDPAQHLGGAVFYFLRGVAHPETRGCHFVRPDPVLLQAVDALLPLPLQEGVLA